jgi:hypothetical protein
MPAFPASLAPLLKLAGQLDDVADNINRGVLSYHDAVAVAYVRHELWQAAEHLIHSLKAHGPAMTTSAPVERAVAGDAGNAMTARGFRRWTRTGP